LVMITGGIRLVYISFHLGQTSSAMQLSLGYIYLVLPLSGSLILYYAAFHFFELIKMK
jgi:TRAP-type C4-dicarboxylate transport system permease small subunit